MKNTVEHLSSTDEIHWNVTDMFEMWISNEISNEKSFSMANFTCGRNHPHGG